jgi:hypothetical protein
LQEQGPGSLTSSFSGKILADLTGTGIQFTGGSAIAAETNGVWEARLPLRRMECGNREQAAFPARAARRITPAKRRSW